MKISYLIDKYIKSTERAFREMDIFKQKILIGEKEVNQVLSYAKDYLEDAKYYRDIEKFETSLTSIAYCEGLLDGLKLLGTIDLP